MHQIHHPSIVDVPFTIIAHISATKLGSISFGIYKIRVGVYCIYRNLHHM